MKKVIIAAVAIAMSVVANAASTSWRFTSASMVGADLTTAYSGTVYLWASGGDLEGETLIKTWDTTNGSVANQNFSSDAFTYGESYDFIFKLTSSKDGTDYELVSTVKSVTALETGTSVLNWGNQKTYTSTAGNWTTAAVPEPTSGLLMLVGLAGLALRRRRA